MSIDLEQQLVKYYETIKNPLYRIDNWIIANNELYNIVYNNLTISNIISVNQTTTNQLVIVFDTKKEYYALKYNSSYICLKVSSTEYGLITEDYQLLAVDQNIVYTLVNNKEMARFRYLCKLFKWRISKRAKDDLDYFKNI
jgi:hypothetical protein